LSEKVDFFATYIIDFFGPSDAELNSLQIRMLFEEIAIYPAQDIPFQKTVIINEWQLTNEYLLEKVDFFATYIIDFFGPSDAELNFLQICMLFEEIAIYSAQDKPFQKNIYI
jgi:hypothetical protein